jgi:hypothetical protein
VRINELSFRSGKEAIAKRPEILASIFAAIVNAQEAQLRRPMVSIEKHLQRELLAESWMRPKKNLLFQKKRIALYTEFSHYEFIYRDLFELLVAHNADKIDVGVILTNTTLGSRRVKQKFKGSHFDHICSDLEWLRPAFSLPVWVIGLR